MDMDAENRQNQLSELEALESVLRKGKIQKLTNWADWTKTVSGFIQVDFDTIIGKPIEFKGNIHNAGGNFSQQLKFLPSVRLRFDLPTDYPSVSSPTFTLHNTWMTEEQKVLCENALKSVCGDNQGMMLLYFCYQTIIDTVEKLQIECIDLNKSFFRVLFPTVSLRELRNKILLATEQTNAEVFAGQIFHCQICFDAFYGSDCFKFLKCEHVSCKNCVAGYYQSLANGMISNNFTCLEIGCDTEAHEELIQEALGEELFKKYDEALLQKAISEIGDTTECARETCKMLAYITDKEKNLVECSYCGYNFCHLCKQTYHGVSACKIRAEDVVKIIDQWQNGDEEDRAALSEKYGGEKTIEEWVHKMLNNQWMDDNTKNCPACDVKIEKSDGCNKMHCARCKTDFCWLCESIITNGYVHFSDRGYCNGRLFENMIIEDE